MTEEERLTKKFRDLGFSEDQVQEAVGINLGEFDSCVRIKPPPRHVLMGIIELRDRMMELAYNASQPRWPKGTPKAGQWRDRFASVQARIRAGSDEQLKALLAPVGTVNNPWTPDPVTPAAPPPGPKTGADKFLEEHTRVGKPETRGAVADVFIVSSSAGEKKVFKRVDNKVEADREEAVALVGQALGANVPKVTRLDDYSIAMEHIEGRTLLANMIDKPVYGAQFQDEVLDPKYDEISIMDEIIQNGDRHEGNVMIDQDGNFWGIDHSYTFDGTRPTNKFERPWLRESMTVEKVNAVRAKLRPLKAEFERLGMEDDYKKMMAGLVVVRQRVAERRPESVMRRRSEGQRQLDDLNDQMKNIIDPGNGAIPGRSDFDRMIALQRRIKSLRAKL